MAKPEVEFYVDDIPWKPIEGAPGMYEKVLAMDPDTGACTRLLKMDPGVETTEPNIHDFWEEVIILEGELYAAHRDETLKKGFYCCRPPGMVHGPVKCPKGVITFEIRG